MFLSRERGFLFLRVPKTASTSIITHLCDNVSVGVKDAYIGSVFYQEHHNTRELINVHANIPDLIQHGILLPDEVKSLRVYGAFRDPIERFISISEFLYTNGHSCQLVDEDLNEIVSYTLSLVKKSFLYSLGVIVGKEFPLYPQTHWLLYENKPISNIFIYSHYENALAEMSGNSSMQHHLRKGQRSRSQTLDSSLIAEIRKIYESDFELKDRLMHTSEREPI